jgi:hypothetical protein
MRIMECRTQFLALRHQPDVTSTKIDVRHGVVSCLGDCAGLVFRRSPKIRDEPACVADNFQRCGRGGRKEYGGRPEEWFDILLRVAETRPHLSRHRPLSAKKGEWRQ